MFNFTTYEIHTAICEDRNDGYDDERNLQHLASLLNDLSKRGRNFVQIIERPKDGKGYVVLVSQPPSPTVA